MSCPCIIQTGKLKGTRCGRPVGPTGMCGFHKKSCVGKESHPPLYSHLDPKVLKYLNNRIVYESLDELNEGMLKSGVKAVFGINATEYKAYRPYVKDLTTRKIRLLQGKSCIACTTHLEALREWYG